jgi:hypothetical protein
LPVLRLDSRHWHVPERPSRGQMLFDVGKCPEVLPGGGPGGTGSGTGGEPSATLLQGEGMEPVVGKGRVLGTVVPR